MRVFLLIVSFTVALPTMADAVSEQLAINRGISCLNEQISIFDGSSLQSISDKVNCREDFSISKANEFSNLDCPEDPIFKKHLYTTNQDSTSKKCLRVSRNQSPSLYENINCGCIEEAVGTDKKKSQAFKQQLRKRIQKNIGKRVKKKIEYYKTSDILLKQNNEKNSCFSDVFFKKRFLEFTKSYKCSNNAIDRIQNMFGDSLGVEKSNNNLQATLNDFIKKVQNVDPASMLPSETKSSCLPSSEAMSEKFISMKYNDRVVNLSESFGDFIKGRNLNSANIKEDFNNYIKEKKIDLHPHIRSLSENHLKEILMEIDRGNNGKDITLNDLLNGPNKEKWLNRLNIAKRSGCASIAQEMAQAICSDAEIAYDDPTVIESFLSDDEEFKKENILNIKNLYCEKKDLHTIDAKGKLLVYPKRFEMANSYKQDPDDLKEIYDNLKNLNPEKAFAQAQEMINESVKGLGKESHTKSTLKLRTLERIEDYILVSAGDAIKTASSSSSTGINQNKTGIPKIAESYISFFGNIHRKREDLRSDQIDDIKNISEDVANIKGINGAPKEQFKNKFVKNFKDRRYTKGLTDKFGSFFPNTPAENMIEARCQGGFPKVYCELVGQFAPLVGVNCVEHAGSVAISDIINTSDKKNNYQNICAASASMTKNSIDRLNKKISFMLDPDEDNFCEVVNTTDWLSDFQKLDNDQNIEQAYYSHHSEDVSSLFRGLRDSENYITIAEDKKEDIQPKEMNTLKASQNKIFKPAKTNLRNSNSPFSNFNYFKDSNFNQTPQMNKLTAMNKDQFEKEIETKKNQELLDYIKQLEEIIRKKEDALSSEIKNVNNGSTVSPEIEKLRKEIAGLKEKSDIIKSRISSTNNENEDKITSKAEVQKSSKPITPLPVFSSKIDRPNTSSEEALSSRDNTTSLNPQTNTPSNNSLSSSSSISLSLNEQFDEILKRPNSGGPIEITFDDVTYRLEVQESVDGEMICKFADEELNNKKKDELDEICNRYVESLARIKKSQVKENKKGKTKDNKKKELLPRKQKYKVEDLNKALSN